MFQPLSKQKEATIYQYQLVRKINLSSNAIRYHYGSGAVLAIALIIVSPLTGFLGLLCGVAFIPFLHFAIARLILIRTTHEFRSRRWRWKLQLPLAGYFPLLPIELSTFTRLQLHTFWLGSCCIAILYPWLSVPLLSGIGLVHLWLISPTLIIALLLHKERKDGVLKLPFEESCFLYYHR